MPDRDSTAQFQNGAPRFRRLFLATCACLTKTVNETNSHGNIRNHQYCKHATICPARNDKHREHQGPDDGCAENAPRKPHAHSQAGSSPRNHIGSIPPRHCHKFTAFVRINAQVRRNLQVSQDSTLQTPVDTSTELVCASRNHGGHKRASDVSNPLRHFHTSTFLRPDIGGY